MNILPGNLRFGAGKPIKRLEDQRLLTGKGAFIDDKPEDGALWLHLLRSPHAHAKILSIDTAEAAKMPGVAPWARELADSAPNGQLVTVPGAHCFPHGRGGLTAAVIARAKRG